MSAMRPLLVCAVLGAAAPLAAQLPRALPETAGMSAARLKRIGPALDSAVARGEAVGIVTMVAKHGKLVEVDSAGYADREGKIPMRPSTLFRLASMTKAITSVAAMMLVEDGKLLLGDPVSRYIPAFRQMQVLQLSGPDSGKTTRARRQITVRDLLTHRSGLFYGFSDAGPIGNSYRTAGVTDGIATPDIKTMAENVDRLARLPLGFQPGAAWEYGLNTDVLGRVVEVVSGKSLSAFMQERIFGPLKMHDTFFYVPDDKLSRLVVPYMPDSTGRLVPMEHERQPFSEGRLMMAGKPARGSQTFFSGGAGLIGTAGDYVRFLQMLANSGTLDGATLLAPKTVELMTRSHTGDLSGNPLGPGNGFGLGFQVLEDPGTTGEYGSPGLFLWGGIYGTTFWVDPKEQIVGVLMIQRFPTAGARIRAVFRNLVYQALVQ